MRCYAPLCMKIIPRLEAMTHTLSPTRKPVCAYIHEECIYLIHIYATGVACIFMQNHTFLCSITFMHCNVTKLKYIKCIIMRFNTLSGYASLMRFGCMRAYAAAMRSPPGQQNAMTLHFCKCTQNEMR